MTLNGNQESLRQAYMSDLGLTDDPTKPWTMQELERRHTLAGFSTKTGLNERVTEVTDTHARLSQANLDANYASVSSVKARSRLVTPGVDAVANQLALQAAVEDAASAGAPLDIRGSFPLTGPTIVPPSAITINAWNGTLTQTDNLRPILKLPNGSSLYGGNFVGKGTDWVNNSTVYDACALKLDVNTSDVTLFGVKGSNLAGAGLFSPGVISKIKMLLCDMKGVGSAIIPASTGQYSGGIVINANNANDIQVIGGSYRDFAQGLTGGAISKLYVGGGVVLNAVGQHAIYFGSTSASVISGFNIESAPLEGIKAQVSDASAIDGIALVVNQGIIVECGSHLVHLANSEAVPSKKHLRTIISNISGKHTAGTAGDSVLLEHIAGVDVHSIISSGGGRVVRALESSGLDLHNIRGENYTQSGIHLNNVTDATIDRVSLKNGSTANNVNEEWGFHVTGAASADLRFSNNKFSDAAGNSAYIFRILAGDIASMSFVNNKGSGASDYGYRAHASTGTELWLGNNLQGTLGAFFNVPTNATAIADTTGATLAALETEVNKLKARMRLLKAIN